MRQPPLFLLLGFSVGVLLGFSLRFGRQLDPLERYVARHQLDPARPAAHVFVRCVVLVQAANPKPHKFVRSIVDTYGRRCNRTLIFSGDEKLQRQFGDQAEVYALGGPESFGASAYSVFHRVAQFVSRLPAPAKALPANSSLWTVFLNEQNFLVPENLRSLALSYAPGQAVLLGRLKNYWSPLSWPFPFVDTHGFAWDAGVALSEEALRLVSGPECGPGWLGHFYAGKGLLDCARRVDALVVDPTDQEGYHLFMEKNLRDLFSTGQFGPREGSFEAAGEKAGCCSDRLVSVGRVAHRDLRVMEYAVYHVRVFGE